ncbi:MAG TPA: two-component regulator propeller domain-containing protein [Methylomirabilota bacterium]|nr:two-component regulator propeller domain-containing protein [Methylomirabilota bacterium]
MQCRNGCFGLEMLLLAIFWMLAQTSMAAGNNAPITSIDGQFAREWLVLGPFPARDLNNDLLANAGGEAAARPREGDTVKTKEGGELAWKRVKSARDVVDLERSFTNLSWSLFYAYCEVDSPHRLETAVRLNAAPHGAVWLNGERIGETGAPLHFDLHPALPVQIEAGTNRCLLKIRFEHEPPYAFAFQLLPAAAATTVFQVTGSDGKPAGDALIELFHGTDQVSRFRTDASGRAEAWLHPLAANYEGPIRAGSSGAWVEKFSLKAGERRQFHVTLHPAVSVAGQVLAMDGVPQSSIVVQAIPVLSPESAPSSPTAGAAAHSSSSGVWRRAILNPEHAPTNDPESRAARPSSWGSAFSVPRQTQSMLTDSNGNFEFINLRPGPHIIRAHGRHGHAYAEGNLGSPDRPITAASNQTHRLTFKFPEARKATWQTHVVRKGLAELNPSTLHRSRDGMLLVGTFQGTLHSYDGVEFKEIGPLGHGDVRAIGEDASGVIWIGSEKAASIVAGGRVEATPFNQKLSLSDVSGIHVGAEGTVWFSSGGGLARFDGKEVRNWGLGQGSPGNQVGGMLESRDGAVWVSTLHSLARFKDGKFTEPVLLSSLRRLNRDRLFQARDGAIWFSSRDYEQGVYRYDGQSLKHLGRAEGLVCDKVLDIAETSDGTLWFATDTGLSSFDGAVVITYPIGTAGGGVQDIVVDADDLIWGASFLQLFRLDPKTFSRLATGDGLWNTQRHSTSVFAIEPDGAGGYWIGTEWGGVHHLKPRDKDRLTAADFLKMQYVRHITRAPDGALMLGVSDGLYRVVDGRASKVLDSKWIIGLTTDEAGKIWFGQGWVGGGASRFDPLTGQLKSFTTADGLPNDVVSSVARATGGGVWIGTEKGLSLWRDGKLEHVSAQLGIPCGAVLNVREDAEGALWIGGAGLHRLKGTNVLSLMPSAEAPIESVWGSAKTPDGILWMATDKNGLLGYDGAAFTMLDKRDGLGGNSVFTVRPDSDGSLLIGFLGDGIGRYRRTKTQPGIRILEAQLEDRRFTDINDLPPAATGKRVSVRYQEIDLKTHPEKRQFRYRVKGPSGETLFAGITRDRLFEWTPRKGGWHTFEVQAIDRDLNYSKFAQLRFRAAVPWYANGWVIFPGGAAVLALLVWAFVALALYRRKSREAALWQERVRFARDLHDHLGAGLTHLAMVGEQVRQNVEQPRAVEQLATRLTESARELTRTMGEIIWMIDPTKGALPSFVSFLTSYAERFFSGTSIRLRFDIPAEIPALDLPEELRRGLFLAVKEALNNVAKHAEASELRFGLVLRDQELNLIVEDDGKGFAMSGIQGDRRGLGNMQQRLRDLGGELSIESVPGRGTRVVARVTLPSARS